MTSILEKVCSICSIAKTYDLFPKYTKTGKPRKWCRDCMKVYKREYPKTNPTYQNRAKIRVKETRIQLARKVHSYLRVHPCVDCLESNIMFLQFDHVKGEKVSSIARMVSNKVKWEIIEKEIAKCQVRCAKCHRKRTNILIDSKRGSSKQSQERAKVRLYVTSYLRTSECVDCGESEIENLDFDHVRGEKDFVLSEAGARKMSKKRIDKEIAKCDIRCINCHIIKTAISFNHIKYLDSVENYFSA